MSHPPLCDTAFVDRHRASQQLLAVQAGQTGAMDALIRTCQPLVRAQASRYSYNPADADDIVQTVWERLLRHADQIRNPDTLVAWLVTVTKRTAFETGRRQHRAHVAVFDDAPSLDDTEDEAIRRSCVPEISAAVEIALSKLNTRDRHLMILLHERERPAFQAVSRAACRPVGSLGPTRLRLLRRLRADTAIERLRVSA